MSESSAVTLIRGIKTVDNSAEDGVAVRYALIFGFWLDIDKPFAAGTRRTPTRL